MPYVDPGTGSFVLQAVAATLAGALVALNGYWKKLRSRLGRGSPDADSGEPTEGRRE